MGKLVNYNFFYKSEAFQMFIRGPSDFLKASLNIKSPTFTEIYENFKLVFTVQLSFEVTPQIEENINQTLSSLKDNLSKIKDFKRVCKNNVLSFFRFESSIISLSAGLNEITNYFFPNKDTAVEINKKSTNPYKILLDWARRETLEIESYIEIIEKKLALDAILAKNQAKLGKQQHGLENFQSGKKTILQRFSKKPNEIKAKELEIQILESEKELQSLQEIIKIATERLVNYQYPLFKEKEVDKLESTIRCYSGLVVEEYNDFISHFTNLQECITPSVI